MAFFPAVSEDAQEGEPADIDLDDEEYGLIIMKVVEEDGEELLSTLDGCVYAERVCVTDIANINKAKKAIKKAFQKQMNGEGFTFIEVLSTCPTNWGMTPLKAVDWLKDNMIPYYPLGVIKEVAPENAEVK